MEKSNDYNELLKNGYVIEPALRNMEELEAIRKMKTEKDALILAHYYQIAEIQDIADFVGDSLFLSQKAAMARSRLIVFCGVHFMAETAKILSPNSKVVIPDLNAGCSLADSCKASDFSSFLKDYPNHTVISYINTTAEIKAMSDIICTSSNAVKIVESIPENRNIVFAPDRNLGNYIASVTGRDMVIWDGACHVHEEFSLERIIELKEMHPDAKIIAHPECRKPVRIVSDFIGSTAALLKFTAKDDSMKFIVATESGIIHQMRLLRPDKFFIPAPPIDSTCGCNDCRFMKLNTVHKLYVAMKHELPEVEIEENIRILAEKPIRKMLELSEKFGL